MHEAGKKTESLRKFQQNRIILKKKKYFKLLFISIKIGFVFIFSGKDNKGI